MKHCLTALFLLLSRFLFAENLEILPPTLVEMPHPILPIETAPEEEEEDLVADRSGHQDNERPNMFDMMQERRHEERRMRLLEEHSRHRYRYDNR